SQRDKQIHLCCLLRRRTRHHGRANLLRGIPCMAEVKDFHGALITEACTLLERLVNNTECGLDERVLARAKLKSWGQGNEFACCRIHDTASPRANRIEYSAWDESELPALKEERVVASQQMCANDLDVPMSHVRSAVTRL